jgi:hypothetical protein
MTPAENAGNDGSTIQNCKLSDLIQAFSFSINIHHCDKAKATA